MAASNQTKWGLVYWCKSKTQSIVKEAELIKVVPNIHPGWKGDLPWTDEKDQTKPFKAKLIKLSCDKKALEKITLSKEGKIITTKELQPELYQQKLNIKKTVSNAKKAGVSGKQKLGASTVMMKSIVPEDSSESDSSDDVQEISSNTSPTSNPTRKKQKDVEDSDSNSSSSSDEVALAVKFPSAKNVGAESKKVARRLFNNLEYKEENLKEKATPVSSGPRVIKATSGLCDRCLKCDCRKRVQSESHIFPRGKKAAGYAVNNIQIELVQDSGVFISSNSLESILLRAGGNFRALIRGLLFKLFTTKELGEMSAKGCRNKKPLPNCIRDTLLSYVRKKLNVELREETFLDVGNKTCQNARISLLSPSKQDREKQRRRLAAKASRERKKLAESAGKPDEEKQAEETLISEEVPATAPRTELIASTAETTTDHLEDDVVDLQVFLPGEVAEKSRVVPIDKY